MVATSSSVVMPFSRYARAPAFRALVDILVAIVGGEHNEPGVGSFHAYALDDVHSAHPWQAQVHQRDVRLVLAKLGDGFNAVGSLAHHLKTIHHIQQRHQSLAHHVVIFNNQDPDRIAG